MTLCKLAWGNVRRAGRDYLVYLVTLALGVTVFYAFNTISFQIEYAGLGDGLADSLGGTIGALTVFLAVVMGFLMVYANNFIMKRRKKQFGLYQVLGMGRAQVAVIMTLETAIVSLGALCVGLAAGLGLSQLMTFFTASLFRTQISNFHFFFSMSALRLTAACLVAIFAVTLACNLRVAARARVIDLVSASRRGETLKVRNPWVSAALFVVGAALVGISYARLWRDGLPVNADDGAMGAFYLTTAMVVCGTLLVFFGLSGFLLKVLQVARGLYWRGLNMFTLRQLAARVNTVSFSMALISMILFLAITSVSTGMSIANMLTGNVERSTPADYSASMTYYSPSMLAQMRRNIERGYGEGSQADELRAASTSTPADLMGALATASRAEGEPVDVAKLAGTSVQVNTYDSRLSEDAEPLVTVPMFTSAGGESMPKGFNESSITNGLALMKESDYNRYLAFRGMEQVSLGGNSYLVTCDLGESLAKIYDAAMAKGFELTLAGNTLRPARERVDLDASTFANNSSGMNVGTVVVPDAVVEALGLSVENSYLLVNYAAATDKAAADAALNHGAYGAVHDGSGNEVGSLGVDYTRTSVYESSNSINGLISYLAIYIGFVLVVACGAILTIQQLSGVAEAAEGWHVLSELGCDEGELRRSLLAQQAVFFAFPLAVGTGHALVALKVVVDIVESLGHLAIGPAAGLTMGIFVACYGGYFVLTYLMGTSILRSSVRARTVL